MVAKVNKLSPQLGYSYIIALDLSLTQTGCAVVDLLNGRVQTCAIQTPASEVKGLKRLQKIHQSIVDIIVPIVNSQLKPKILFSLEGYAYGFKQKTTSLLQLGELGGIVKSDLYRAGHDFVVVQPTAIKKFVVGGRAQKDEMRLGVFKKWGFEAKTPDEIDAFALAMATYEIISKPKSTVKYEYVAGRDNEEVKELAARSL